MRISLAVVSCILFLSCVENPKKGAFAVHSFISLDSIMQEQEQLLEGRYVAKRVMLNDRAESDTVTIDPDFFDTEWSFLQEFDLNKPVFVGGIEVTQSDDLIRYESKPDQDYMMQFLQYRFGESQELVQISGAFRDEKARSLYESTRNFEFNFSGGIMKQYIVSGYQKIVLKDTVFFAVTGEIQ